MQFKLNHRTIFPQTSVKQPKNMKKVTEGPRRPVTLKLQGIKVGCIILLTLKSMTFLNKTPVPQETRQNLQQTGLYETKMLVTGREWAVHRIGENEWQLFIQQKIGVQHTEKTKKTKYAIKNEHDSEQKIFNKGNTNEWGTLKCAQHSQPQGKID